MQPRYLKLRASWQVIMCIIITSLMLTACDAITVPEDEELSFEGPPEVTIASPLTGDTYQEGVGVNILLRIDNAGPDVARIAIEVDGQIIGEAILPNPNGDPSFTVSNGWPASGEGQHTISAVASRSDGTVSETASVTINVVANEMAEDASTDDETDNPPVESQPTEDMSAQQAEPTTEPQSQFQSEPTQAPTATTAPTSTPAATNTPNRPQVVVRTGANVRSGPGLVFDPPIGSLAAGVRANILALNNAGTWYKIEYYNGDAWISSLVVDVTGNTGSLPREAGPATPIPPTPVPPTNTPAPVANVDLFIDAAQSSFVPSFVCAQSSQITITVVNAGTETSQGARILIEDIQPDGTVGATTETVVGALGPNESQTATAALTVSTFVSEVHTFRARVDPNNSVPETNDNNNSWEEVYTLEPGNC